MHSEKAENPQKSTLQIRQDDKFFCRLLSRETSISDASFRVTPVAVPFLWESQPGTPKHPISDLSLPPLTPPPSYYYTTTNKPIHNKNNNPSRSNLFRFLFSRLNLKKALLLLSSYPPPSLSSSSSSSSSSLDSSRDVGSNGRRRRRRFLSCDSSVDLWGNCEEKEEEDDDDDDVANSRNSSLCFGIRRSPRSNGFGSCRRRQA